MDREKGKRVQKRGSYVGAKKVLVYVHNELNPDGHNRKKRDGGEDKKKGEQKTRKEVGDLTTIPIWSILLGGKGNLERGPELGMRTDKKGRKKRGKTIPSNKGKSYSK